LGKVAARRAMRVVDAATARADDMAAAVPPNISSITAGVKETARARATARANASELEVMVMLAVLTVDGCEKSEV
jgi:hypothetical protein